MSNTDNEGQPVDAGDRVRFSFGIPALVVLAPIELIDGELWAMTPTCTPQRCRLAGNVRKEPR